MRTTRRRVLDTLTAALLAALLIGNGLAYAAPPERKGGGGGGGTTDPPPDLPPVRYALQRFAMPADYVGGLGGTIGVEGFNDFGEAVGLYGMPSGYNQPFYYSATSGASVATNLNDLSFEEGNGIPPDFYISSAWGINNWGDICGSLRSISDPDRLRGFVIELRPDPLDPVPVPRMHLIPDDAWYHTYAVRINDAGEVLGSADATTLTSYVYRPALHGLPPDESVGVLPIACDARSALFNSPLNGRPAQVVWGYPLQCYTLGDAGAELLGIDGAVGGISGLNDAGLLCGTQYVAVRKNRTESQGYWYDGTIHAVPGIDSARTINESRDMVGTNNVLAHAAHGLIDLNALLVTANDAERQIWMNNSPKSSLLTERNPAGIDPSVADFPAIAGRLRRYDTGVYGDFFYDGYVLLPVPPQ